MHSNLAQCYHDGKGVANFYKYKSNYSAQDKLGVCYLEDGERKI